MPGGALTTGANTSFVLAGGVCETDVFWAPVGATTIGADTAFVGNILDPAGITIGNASTFMVIANPPNASLECGVREAHLSHKPYYLIWEVGLW